MVGLDVEGEVGRAVEAVAAHLGEDRQGVAGSGDLGAGEGGALADQFVLAPGADPVVAPELAAPVVDVTVGGERRYERVVVRSSIAVSARWTAAGISWLMDSDDIAPG